MKRTDTNLNINSQKIQNPQIGLGSHRCFNSMSQLISKINFSSQNLSNNSKQSINLIPLKSQKTSLQGAQLNQPHNYLMSSFQSSKKLYYIFASYDKQKETFRQMTKIVIWQFLKQNGQNKKIQFKNIKGKVTVMKMGIISIFNEKQMENVEGSFGQNQVCIILATSQGYIKTISLNSKPQIKSVKISHQTCKIVQITSFFHPSIDPFRIFYFVLLQNNQILLININNFDIICKFRANIIEIPGQQALCLQHKHQQSSDYLIQCTKGGYLIIWKLDIQFLLNSMKQSINNKFKASKILDIITTKYISHELSIIGWIWMELWGNLLIFVDRKCILRLYSINIQDRLDFIQIFSINLPNHDFNNKQNKHRIQLQQPNQLYSQPFSNPYLNFFFFPQSMTLYYLLQSSSKYLYKLKLNQFMQIQLFQIFKLKLSQKQKFKNGIQQFLINSDEDFLIMRSSQGFVIKVFDNEEIKKRKQCEGQNVQQNLIIKRQKQNDKNIKQQSEQIQY